MNIWHTMIDNLPWEWSHYAFMRNALAAAILLSPTLSLLGCLVVNARMSFFSEAIGHATLTGVAIGVLLGFEDPTPAMMSFAVILALAITVLRHASESSSDTIIGLTMSFAVAIGVVLLSRGGSFARYSRYLVGDILTVSGADLLRLVLLDVFFAAFWLRFFNDLLLAGVNSSLARSRGVRILPVEFAFSAMVAAAVTASISLVGLLVINSMLIMPAAASRQVARSTNSYLAIAAGVGVGASVAGLIASFYWQTATGATIVIIQMALFAIALMLRRR